MPLIALFGTALSFLTTFFITKALLALGLGFVTYIGISELHAWFEAEFILGYNSMPPDMYAIATLAGLDVAVKILLSAVAAAWEIATVGAGATALLRFTGITAGTP